MEQWKSGDSGKGAGVEEKVGAILGEHSDENMKTSTNDDDNDDEDKREDFKNSNTKIQIQIKRTLGFTQ